MNIHDYGYRQTKIHSRGTGPFFRNLYKDNKEPIFEILFYYLNHILFFLTLSVFFHPLFLCRQGICFCIMKVHFKNSLKGPVEADCQPFSCRHNLNKFKLTPLASFYHLSLPEIKLSKKNLRMNIPPIYWKKDFQMISGLAIYFFLGMNE